MVNNKPATFSYSLVRLIIVLSFGVASGIIFAVIGYGISFIRSYKTRKYMMLLLFLTMITAVPVVSDLQKYQEAKYFSLITAAYIMRRLLGLHNPDLPTKYLD